MRQDNSLPSDVHILEQPLNGGLSISSGVGEYEGAVGYDAFSICFGNYGAPITFKIISYSDSTPVTDPIFQNWELGAGDSTINNRAFEGVSPENSIISQGQNNDCWLIAAQAGLAKARPQDLVQMINEINDGSFTLTIAQGGVFGNGGIPRSSIANLSYVDGGGQGSPIWSSLIEVAYAWQHRLYTGGNVNLRNAAMWLVLNTPGLPGTGIRGITGHTSRPFNPFLRNPNALKADITRTLANNGIVFAATSIPLFGLSETHIYTVIGYNEGTDKVKLRNPWGRPDVELGADFEMSYAQFRLAFWDIAFENN